MGAKANTNIRTLAGKDILKTTNPRLQEFRKKWFYNPENFIVEDFPLFLDVEATSRCNLKCPFCSQSFTKFKRGDIPFSIYTRIIDEAADNNCYGVKFHTISRGEPLLHKKIVRMVKYAKDRGLVDVYLNTNATLLDQVMSLALLTAGLDRISFSIDDYESKAFERKRPGANFNRVLANVNGFKGIRDIMGFDCGIRIQAVDIPGLDKEKYKNFWLNYADEICIIGFKDMTTRDNDLDDSWSCPQLWQRLSVLFDGTILPCNHDDRELAVLGKFPDTLLKEAWLSDKLGNIRMLHKLGESNKVDACRGCFLRTSTIKNRVSY